jgi:glycerol-1-phosphate dehydrogenase [NAD(P)+]
MYWRASQVGIPTFVRIKPDALGRLGIYAQRDAYRKPVFLVSAGLPQPLSQPVIEGFEAVGIELHRWIEVDGADFDSATNLLAELPSDCDVLFGLGGGKCLDVAKYVASLAGWPYYAVPTSLSNDGFCAPQSSLLLRGRRRSLPAQLPFGVVVDIQACLQAPDVLWWSGVGDLVAKLTAVRDWKLAYHQRASQWMIWRPFFQAPRCINS